MTASDKIVTSKGIVKEWARRPEPPDDKAKLQDLWNASGRPQANDWDAGAVYLADALDPHKLPGQKIDQAYIQSLNPNTVGQLGDDLGW